MSRNKVLAWVLVFYLFNPTIQPSWAASVNGSPIKQPAQLAELIGEAYGGFAKLKEINDKVIRSHCKAITTSVISEASNSFDCEVISSRNKLRLEMDMLGQKNITGYNGTSGWNQVGDWVTRSTDTSVQRLKDEIDHGLNALEELHNPEAKLEILPAKTVQNRLCDVIKVTPKNGKWTIFYTDPTSHLVLRSEFLGHDSEQGVEKIQAAEYFDYRLVEGLPTPFKSIEYLDDKKTSETITLSMNVDTTSKNDIFEMPAESLVSGLEAGPITIPFEYMGNEIVISAQINDGKEGKFIVDSGASQTVVDKRTAQEIGPYTVSTFSVTTGAKAVPLSYTKLNKIQLGNLSVENAVALVSDLSSFSAIIGQPPAGLIGANILRRFLVTIDYAERKMTLADPNKVEVPPGAICIPTSPVFGATALVVSGALNGSQKMNFLVDTGAAFNNLPQSLANKMHAGTVIPVGQIYGLDGQKISIGSLKFNNIKIGDFEVRDPVFVLQPDNGPTAAKGGLFSAGAMGILGNPLWSRTKLSIDYRNERLILEFPANQAKYDKLHAELNDYDRLYLKDGLVDAAIKHYEELAKEAQEEQQKAIESLAVARIASCYADKFYRSKEMPLLDMASREYERAGQLANESHDKNAEGQILAQRAMLYLNVPRNTNDLISGQALLQKALSKAPEEASIFASLGTAIMKTGQTQLSSKFIDQALLLDPSNWQALWTKFHQAEGKTADQKLVLDQLVRYYPDFPQVTEALSKAKRAAAAATVAPKPKPVSKTPARKK